MIPWCPRVNAIAVPLSGGTLYLFGDNLRTTAKGVEFLQFNIAADLHNVRFVVAGFRLMRGQIHPPSAQKFKTFFIHFWAGAIFREALHMGVKQIKRHLSLGEDWDKATSGLALTIAGVEKLAEKCDNIEVVL